MYFSEDVIIMIIREIYVSLIKSARDFAEKHVEYSGMDTQIFLCLLLR